MLDLSSSAAADVSPARCPFKERVFSEWNVCDADAVEPLLGGAACESLEQAGRLAWRNAARCIGRLHWRSLKVLDARSVATPDDMADSLAQHLQIATNGGRIRPVMSVFAAMEEAGGAWDVAPGMRIWNHQLLGYAGYRDSEGRVLGDPLNVAITQVALALGWRPPHSRTRFDVLPWVLQCNGRLKVYPIPPMLVREVALRHPRYDWFEKLGLRWYAVPAVSSMLLATGDALYPCAPFNGWYMGTEIGSRDLGDEKRYDQLPVIAEQLGLNMASPRSLWRDHAMLVLNEAVLNSFESDGVRLVDHHQAAAEFMRFCAAESAEKRVVSADWSWIVPPMSGSATPVFHRTYAMEPELPNLLIQTEPWRTAEGRQLLQQQGAWPCV
jgi:nitric-oxide synthase